MWRMFVIAIVAGLLTAGCARETEASAPPTAEASAGAGPAGVKEAEVYVQVLRRYLGTPLVTLTGSMNEAHPSGRTSSTKSQPPSRGWLTWHSSPTGTP
jgi:hypothetical protein